MKKNQRKERDELICFLPVIGEAYQLKELINDLMDFIDIDEAAVLFFLCDIVDESEINPFNKFTKTLKIHCKGIMNDFKYKGTNVVLKG